MSFVDRMNKTATQDWELLRALDELNDNVSIARDVEFVLVAPTRERAQQVAEFLDRQCDGSARVREFEGEFSVRVIIHMPVRRQMALSVSGFMVCVCRLFDLQYDGWSCTQQARAVAAH